MSLNHLPGAGKRGTHLQLRKVLPMHDKVPSEPHPLWFHQMFAHGSQLSQLKMGFTFRAYGPAKTKLSGHPPTLGTRPLCISGPLFICWLAGEFLLALLPFGGFWGFLCLLVDLVCFLFHFLFGVGFLVIWDFTVLFSPVLGTGRGSTQHMLYH